MGPVQEDQGFAIIRVTTHGTWGTVVLSNIVHRLHAIWTLTLWKMCPLSGVPFSKWLQSS